jgi:hydroxyethylthiazole kinase-like uncharacterized protein yjeF
MQKLFDEVGSLDRRCYEEFFLSEELLMEHAANGMAEFIKAHFSKDKKVLFVVGSGNNGADALACARLLHPLFDVKVLYAKPPKSPMAQLQHKRNLALNIPTCHELMACDILVDALVGTGFDGAFSSQMQELIHAMNRLEAYKIACDVPSGLSKNGTCHEATLKADTTLTMGALKKSLFLDEAKEFVGAIKVLDLGISRELYETQSSWHVVDFEDMKLPWRVGKNTHKGSYGHLAVALGAKSGASIMSALSALRFGAGLVTLVGFENKELPHAIMYSHEVPHNATALALGMGLGNEFSDEELQHFLDNTLAMVVDADMFHMPYIESILKRKDVVLTPHPREFVSLLKLCDLADITTQQLQANRFEYVALFCKKYPHVTLLLKGANVIIAQDRAYYINPHGTSALAKGGSGDVLSGLIGALLAQGYAPLDAAISASLTHAKLAKNYKGCDFSLTPDDLIEGLKEL